MIDPKPKKQRIAVLGGGVGAMSAAYELTEQPGWSDRLEIDIYQMGWRLGGKGASGRNAEYGMRIEEHGLHIWLGFYDNAFRLMNRCYAELGRPAGSPMATVADAFSNHSTSELMENIHGEWRIWPIEFPTNEAKLGEGTEVLSPWSYVRMMSAWLVGLFDGADLGVGLLDSLTSFHPLAWVERAFRAALRDVEEMIHPTALHAGHALIHSLPLDPAQHTSAQHRSVISLLETFREQWFTRVGEKIHDDDALRRLGVLMDLGITSIRGMIADGTLFHGFDPLDEEDFHDWLVRHGMRAENQWCAPVRALYDLVFAYEEGDIRRPNLAAGASLRIIVRMFCSYKGAIFQKMMAGMGDIVFGPMYEVMKRRGVRFHFFHKVHNLALSDDKQSIAKIQIGVQATSRDPGGYDPLIDVKGLPCWPSEPLFDRLVEGDAIRASGSNLELSWGTWKDVGELTLESGKDFDRVILGISCGAFPYVCPELIAARQDWRVMVDRVKSVRTKAFQIWMSKSSAELGWPISSKAQMGAYVEPLDTWADMSHLLPQEQWPEGVEVKSVSYFCGALKETPMPDPPFSDPSYAASQELQTRDRATHFLQSQIRPLWPKGGTPENPDGLDWNLLVDPKLAQGEARFESQYWRANVEPTERYVMTVKGSTRYRLRPEASGFANLVLAGDWTYNGINAGCVEAAVMSGMMASRAISGFPQEIVGETDFTVRGA